MYYVIEDTEDKHARYAILITNSENLATKWSGSWYTHLSSWNDTSAATSDNSANETINDWLKDMSSCRVLLEHPSLTAEILQTEYPELFI